MDFATALSLKKTKVTNQKQSSSGSLKDPEIPNKIADRQAMDSISKEMMNIKISQDEGKNGTIDKNIDLVGKNKQQNSYLFIEQFLKIK